MNKHRRYGILTLLLLCFAGWAQAQNGGFLRQMGSRVGNIAGGGASGGGDSLVSRSKFEDSVTVTIYYLDSSNGHKLDSSIGDFTRRYPIPATHINLGNTGTATRSLLFSPVGHAGWDAGFHALDVYRWSLEKTPFFNTTRPYTELDYLLGSRAEQIIEIMHTQNIRPYWNFSIDYRLINSTGTFRNQRTNHNNYRFTSWYQSPNKRYNNYVVLLGNKLQAGENGGIQQTRDLDTVKYAKDRFLIPTRLGGDATYATDFFTTVLYTGNQYKDFSFYMRQQYDFGRKDSLVTDSTVLPLFFPKLRFEHDFTYATYDYSYRDIPVAASRQSNIPDSAYYHDFYNIVLPVSKTLLYRDRWKEVTNDFSIYQFPDSKNLHQFFKLGATLQLMHGSFFKDSVNTSSTSFYNFMGHGEYRNRTRNQKWDLLADAQLYLNGYNLGDYHAYASLQRILSPKLGSFQVGFENTNRTAPYIYNTKSAFYLDAAKSFNKENIIHLFAALQLKKYGLDVSGDYYLVSNYLYLTDFYRLQQEGTIFNVLRVNALKTFRFGRHWRLYSEVYLQQKTGSAQLNLPVIYTRNRFMYEGNLGFRNLAIAFGLEGRYYVPYKADGYSPVLGQFFYQNSVTIRNLPDVAAFINFRIRSFKAFFRAENLNTANTLGGFQFNNNNLAAPNYPSPGLIIRLGIYWSFVN